MNPTLLRSRLVPIAVLASIAAFVACSAPPPTKASRQEAKGDDDDDDDADQDSNKEGQRRQASAASGGDGGVTPPRSVLPPTPANTCETARGFGQVIGDAAGNPAMTEGRCAEWVRVRVVEQDDGWFGTAVKLKATLTPPAGGSFDLAAFVNVDADLAECRTPTGSSRAANGGAVEIDLGWGEGFLANSVDDSRTLTLQIRSTTGQCSEQPWRLAITQQP
jgi:hypothetical protein